MCSEIAESYAGRRLGSRSFSESQAIVSNEHAPAEAFFEKIRSISVP